MHPAELLRFGAICPLHGLGARSNSEKGRPFGRPLRIVGKASPPGGKANGASCRSWRTPWETWLA